jgi:CBS-domain-containing membrane protein
MTREVVVIEPGLDVYGIVQAFLEHPVRRLPVVEGDSLMGLVTRRDLMLGVAAMRKERAPHSRYPDYPPDRIPLQSHYREHWSEERPSHSRLRRFRPR